MSKDYVTSVMKNALLIFLFLVFHWAQAAPTLYKNI